MERVSFANQEGPLMLSVIKEQTPSSAIAVIKNSLIDGAQGFDLHISTLVSQYLSEASISKIAESTDKPILALHYNSDYFGKHMGISDEDRMRQLLMAVKAGCSALDMQGYTFEEDMASALDGCGSSFAKLKPREVTMRQKTIDRQRKFIDEVHAAGGEVVLSTHTGVMMTAEQTVELALELEKRGADVIKIIANMNSAGDFPEICRTTLELKKHLKTKFAFHSQGKLGKPTRIICPMLGSYMVFCFDRYTESSNFEQCHLKSMADAFKNLDWRMK